VASSVLEVWLKKFGAKAALKMLVKLTSDFTNVNAKLKAAFTFAL
jgi:hypothetical protein